MPIDFPSSPTTGQVYTYEGKSWVYNGTGWDSPRALSEIGAVQTFENAAARTAAIPTPTEGIVSYLVDTNALELYNNGWNVINPSSGNAIINGAFDIWQRGTSFTTSGTTGIYTADRWLVAGDAANSTISRQTFTPGSAPESGQEGQFFLRYVKGGTTANQMFLIQRLEDVRTFAGQTVTLSYWAKASTALTNTPLIQQNFGSGGSGEVYTGAASQNLTTSWARYSVTVAVPSVSGKTIGASSFVGFWPIRYNGTSNVTIDIWGVQLEAGAVATPFRRNAPSIQAELAACQRYFQVAEPERLIGSAVATTAGLLTGALPTTMRSSPTVTLSSGSSISINFFGDGISSSSSFILTGHSGSFNLNINTLSPPRTQFSPLQATSPAFYFNAEL